MTSAEAFKTVMDKKSQKAFESFMERNAKPLTAAEAFQNVMNRAKKSKAPIPRSAT